MKQGTVVSLVTLAGEYIGKWVKEEHGNITLENPRMLVNTPDGKVGFARGICMTGTCLLYTSPSPRDTERSRMPSSA